VKTLCLVRHAKSSWGNPALSDFERPLNGRGERDAPRMAKRLKEKRIVFDLILSSPAQRALSTALHFAKVLETPPSILKTEPALYHASPDTMMNVIRHLKDTVAAVVIVAHNPGLTDFVNECLQERIVNISTCGIVACTLPITHWADATWGKGRKLFYDYPKLKASS
jgi:phosphohistidine phosphatase